MADTGSRHGVNTEPEYQVRTWCIQCMAFTRPVGAVVCDNGHPKAGK
jgi:hypothetical protein